MESALTYQYWVCAIPSHDLDFLWASWSGLDKESEEHQTGQPLILFAQNLLGWWFNLERVGESSPLLPTDGQHEVLLRH